MGRKKRKPQKGMARRLQAVVSMSGLTLKAFHEKLVEDGEYSVAYQSVQNYHFDRDAPAHYLARVATVFGSDLVYLVTGKRGGADDWNVVKWEDWIRLAGQTMPDLRFFGPFSQTGLGRGHHLMPFVTEFRHWSGRPTLFQDYPGEGSLTNEEMENIIRETQETYRLMDDVFADAWEGMRNIVAHEFGPAVADNLTLDQQTRFIDAMQLALTSLFPDHGHPAAFKED